jgi:hypothetical protein
MQTVQQGWDFGCRFLRRARQPLPRSCDIEDINGLVRNTTYCRRTPSRLQVEEKSEYCISFLFDLQFGLSLSPLRFMMIYDIDISFWFLRVPECGKSLGVNKSDIRTVPDSPICRTAGRTEMAGEDRTKSASLRRALVSCLAKFYEGKWKISASKFRSFISSYKFILLKSSESVL